jgi:hypothetical protein
MFYNIGPWDQCYKNMRVNFCRNFTPNFCRVKTPDNATSPQYSSAILGQIMLYNIGYTNTMVIYCDSTVITELI